MIIVALKKKKYFVSKQENLWSACVNHSVPAYSKEFRETGAKASKKFLETIVRVMLTGDIYKCKHFELQL